MAKKALIAPKHVSVRYDNDSEQWSILDSNDNPVNGFKKGYLTDVTFRTRVVTKYLAGCGTKNTNIGIATGMFTEGAYSFFTVGFRNLKFNDNTPGFENAEGKPLFNAKVVRLLTNRKALVKE